jgi:hypothetical protein
MAGFELRMSAAWCINLALFTSASADIIFALESRYVFEVIERSLWMSAANIMSFMKICSTYIPECRCIYPICLLFGRQTIRSCLRFLVFFKADPGGCSLRK